MANKNGYVTVTPVDKNTGVSPTLPKTQAPVKTVQNPNKGTAELPVQKPGAGAPVQTMSSTPTQPAAQNDTAAYNSMNQQVWGEGGTGLEGYDQVLELEKQYQQQTGTGSNPHSDEALRQQLIAAGIDPALLDEYSNKGGWTQNRDTAIAGGGTGEKDESFYLDGDWYYYEGKPRPVTEGHAGADEQFLSDGSLAYVQYCKEKYAEAETDEERAYWHAEAEKTRARAGYSGGADGSMYITLGALGIETNPQTGQVVQRPINGMGTESPAPGTNTGSGTGTGAEIDGLDHVQTEQLKSLLEQWKAAAEEQANGKIDYATQHAITQLERALEDAQPQFKEQAESVSLAERQAMDNAALYAQLRGDQGGIGQEQYNSIQNTAAQNRLAVQQAQTKLSTDTARQIEDLRAQGEFEKADKALEITQSYLQQLVGLEQWALEANLSVDQFNIQLQQWQKEFDMAMQELMMGQERWEKEFAFQQEQAAISNQQWQQQFNASLEQWEKEFGLSQEKFNASLDQWREEFGLSQDKFEYDKLTDAQKQQASMGEALLGVGIMPSAEQLSAMGLTQAQAQAYISTLQTSSGSGANMTTEEVFLALNNAGLTGRESSSVLNMLYDMGITGDRAKNLAGAYAETGYKWAQEAQTALNDATNFYDKSSLDALGLNKLVDIGVLADTSYTTIDSMIGKFLVAVTDENGNPVLKDGKPVLKWAPGWSAQSFINGYPAITGGAVKGPLTSKIYE